VRSEDRIIERSKQGYYVAGKSKAAFGGMVTESTALAMLFDDPLWVLLRAYARLPHMPLILILVILLLVFGGGGYYMGPGIGYYGGGGLSIVLLIIILFLLFGRGRRGI
jgi:hypothetical protein